MVNLDKAVRLVKSAPRPGDRQAGDRKLIVRSKR